MARDTFKVFKISLFLICLMFIGCEDIFSVRDSENPQNITKTILSKTPKEVMNNFETLLSNNQYLGYANLFSDSILNGDDYKFIPENQISYNFDNWNKLSEEKFAENLFKDYAFQELTLDGFNTNNLNEIEDDSLFVDFNYDGILIKFEEDTLLLRGKSKFLLKKYNSFWYISQWFDKRMDDDYETFTSLKTRFL